MGIEAVHAGECGFAKASDQAILDEARVQSQTIVTLDSDFHTILAVEGARKPSVVRFRWEGLRGPEMANLIAQVVETTRDELELGAVVSVRPGGLRLRLLPMRGETGSGEGS
jgi:predicted nuclease of predicted toxin-antitoxin system